MTDEELDALEASLVSLQAQAMTQLAINKQVKSDLELAIAQRSSVAAPSTAAPRVKKPAEPLPPASSWQECHQRLRLRQRLV